MPASIPTPSINISANSSSSANNNNSRYNNHNNHSSTASTPFGSSFHGQGGFPSLSNSSAASSPFNPEALAAATALRRPSLVLSIGSFHSAQLRRPSFFAPFPYSQSPQLSDSIQPDYSSSPRRGDVYQRELEANYCKNFSCCGLTLGDLHALLQHYEEAHVRFEEDDDNGHPVPAGFTDEDGWSTGSDSGNDHAQSNGRHNGHGFHNNNSKSHSASAANAAAAATVAALTASHQQQQHQKLTPLSFLTAKKKNNGVSLSDIYSEDSSMTPDDAVSAFPNSILRTTAQAEFSNLASKKRDLSTYSTSFDTHSPMAKKVSNFQNVTLTSTNPLANRVSPNTTATSTTTTANAASLLSSALSSMTTGQSTGGSAKSQEELLSTVTDYLEHAIQQGLLPDVGEVGSPAYLKAAEDLIRKREELVSIMESIGKSGSSGADKPYRCTVSGCDKAYKNPNGLKYHNQHGHCSASGLSDAEGPESKPYVCSFLECGKRYKNLNGLKYHIEHSHPNLTAALKAHQAGLTSHPLLMNGAFANNQAAAMTLAAALSAVEASPMMMAAINAISASAANQNNQNNSNSNSSTGNTTKSSSLVEQTPDSSPNTSPSTQNAATTAAITTSLLSSLSAYRNTVDPNVFSTDVTPMTSPVLSRATLPGLNPLSIQTGSSSSTGPYSGSMMMTGLVTPSSLSPTLASAAPKSPTSTVSQVSTLTAALAAVTVEQQRHQQRQQQQLH
ncbi:Transcriptional regulator of ribosomal biogenesis proteins [Linnemannia schmuckeri]|uniref:Transcriptional regulator of ribosomal biogenesis proteins n=1 Tax=Linnemannia schmuckeri TaxID=64567 RepID=A0A9P5R5Z2_9FUNG|nr:Transcriptional regulator of ribosomal biogenesis proteins [Linnemannia schmuckeri]